MNDLKRGEIARSMFTIMMKMEKPIKRPMTMRVFVMYEPGLNLLLFFILLNLAATVRLSAIEIMLIMEIITAKSSLDNECTIFYQN